VKVEYRKGVPAVSRITWFWALVFTFFTSGIFPLGLAIYLSWWVRKRRNSGLAFYGYLVVAALTIIELLPFAVLSHSEPWEAVFTAGALLWIASAFALRRELILYYASPEGGKLEIGPLFTALFSVYYLNYCLWVVRDSA
jgi:hypothetical protein